MSLEEHFKDLVEGVALAEEYFEMPPSHHILASALAKSKNPRTKNKLNLRVYGAYSLPKQWIDKTGDPSEEGYLYQVKFWGIEVNGGKLVSRTLTEEEKAEAEANKGKKGGKGKVEDEPTPEEIAFKEKIQREREELEKMSERDRFFKIQEDSTKTVSLQFGQQKQILQLKNEKLWEFEELVNDENGVFLEFNKIQVAEEEADPKKKAKGKPTETLTPYYARGWVDFTPLMVPGKKHTIQRIPLKAWAPPEPAEGEKEDEQQDQKEDEEGKEPEPIFEDAQTYIYVHISTEFAINPSIKQGEEEEPELPEEEKEEKEQPPQEEKKENEQKLDEPEDSYIEEEEYVEDEKPKLQLNQQVYDDIDLNLGYFSTTADATANFRIIIQKYLKKISDHYSIVMAPDEMEQKSNSKVTAVATMMSSTQRQKKIEKYILQSGKMYAQLKKELKIAIHRIIRDKYHKTVNHSGLSPTAKSEFIASLYTYLCQQIRATLEATVKLYKNKLHEDLVEDLVVEIEEERKRRQEAYCEEYLSKLERLANEYDNIGNFGKAEKFYKKLLLADEKNVSRLLTLAKFYMKMGRVDDGYEYFRRAKEVQPQDKELVIFFAGILIERERYTEAKRVLKEILDEDFKHCQANILYSLIWDVYNRPGLVRKHIAIAKVQRMRELELLPRKVRQIPNLNEINFKLERPNWDIIATKDQNMDSKENDKLFFEVISFMLKFNLTKIAASLLKYIQNKEGDRFYLELSRVKHQEHEYKDAITSVDKVLSKSTNNPEALILRGDIYFDEGNIFDSEESYISFIQNFSTKDAESPEKYYNILERLGIVYVERRAWQDAKTVFLRWVQEYNTTNGWLNLGISCLRLQRYEEAEDALTQANFLDGHNPDVWGYIALLWLKYPNDVRSDQAEFCIIRALKLEIENDLLLEEIGDIYESKKPTFAIACYERAIKINSEKGELYQKYGNVLVKYKKKEIPKAIDLFKLALEKVKGKNTKAHIALVLQQTLKDEGRDIEAEEYAEFAKENESNL
jgi:tetratricopeptide (TPR) repeat protein